MAEPTNFLHAAIDADLVGQKTAAVLATSSDMKPEHLGVLAKDIHASKVTLVAVLLDDSRSMESIWKAVIGALNDNLIAVLKQQQSRYPILFCVMTMWRGVVLPFREIQSVEPLSTAGIYPIGDTTPLFRSNRDVLRVLVEKQAELALESIPARMFLLSFSDGEENVNDVAPDDVARVVLDIDSNSRKNALYGIACGRRAEAAFKLIGFKRVTQVGDAIGIADAFSDFSRATSAAASG